MVLALPFVLAAVLLLNASTAQAQIPQVEFATSPDTPDQLAGPNQYQVMPSRVFFGAGGGLFITKLRWSGWGSAVATGRGRAHLRGGCKPDCAHAGFTTTPAALYVSRVGDVNGHRQYVCWQLKFLRGRHRGQLGAENCRPPSVAPPLPPPPPISYVALGDSYSSGEGVRPFFPGSDDPSSRCHRSTRAYSRLLQLPGQTIGERWFFACSGAVTDNVISADTGGRTQHPGELVPQLDHAEIGLGTNLVTMTLGGDNADFADVLQSCVRPKRCYLGKRRAEIVAGVEGSGPRVLDAFRLIKFRVPNASIVVLGYPSLFPPGGGKCLKLAAFDGPAQRFLNEMGVELNNIIAGAAAAAGVYFDGVTDTFGGHEVCGAKGEWISGITLPRGTDKLAGPGTGSFHPNLAGQRAYATDLQGFLVGLIQSGAPLNSAGLPANPTSR